MKAGEFCAGYGGLMMAIEAVFNAKPAWVSEFDPAPSKILAYHYPTVPNLGDMTKVDWSLVDLVDVMGGGTPCQDLSHAGARKGMTEGTRSNLWVHMREAIAVQKPTWVVWENVRGAYSAGADSDLEFCPGCMGDARDGRTVLRALGRVLGDLSDLGYDVQWRGLRASDVGAPHARFRVFVLARLRVASDRDGKRHERPRDARGRWARSTDRSLTLPNTAGYGRGQRWTEPTGQLGRLHAPSDQQSAAPAQGSKATPNTIRSGRSGRAREARREEIEGAPAERPGEGTSEAADTPSYEGRQFDGDGGIAWGDYEPAIRRWEFVTGRSVPRPTEPTGRAGGERLSPRFTEWMMGLPDGWVTDPAIGISRNEQLKACGNGVVPQQAIAALKDMLNAFQKEGIAA